MKRHIVVLLVVLLLSNLFADGACTTGGSGKCEVGSGKTYPTITACTSVMAAGQTCLVFAGNYTTGADASGITVPAGTALAHTTLQVNNDDLVTVLRVTLLNSYADIVGGLTPNPTTTGLHIENTAAPTANPCLSVWRTATTASVINTHMYACRGVGSDISTGTPNQITLRSNTLTYMSSVSDPLLVNTGGPAINIAGSQWLVELNDISHVSDWFALNGTHNIIRNNVLHDSIGRDPSNLFATWPTGAITPECNPSYTGTAIVSSSVLTGVAQIGQSFPNSWIVLTGVNGGNRIYGTSSTVSGTNLFVAGVPDGSNYTAPSTAGVNGNGGNCHIDGMQSEPSVLTQYNLIEGNQLYNNFGSDAHGFLAQGDVCKGLCHDLIIRYNQVVHFNGGIINDGSRRAASNPMIVNTSGTAVTWVSSTNGFVFDTNWVGGYIVINGVAYVVQSVTDTHNLVLTTSAGTQTGVSANSASYYNVKSYNNSWVDLADYNPSGTSANGINAFTWRSYGGSSINELFWFDSVKASGKKYQPYMCGEAVGGATDSCTGPLLNFVSQNNLAYCGNTCTLLGQYYNAGAFLTDAGPNNVVNDPKFKTYSTTGLGDLHLASGSPAIGAGSPLTTVTGGCGVGTTSIVVNDISFFQDGYGIAGVVPDTIAVTTTGNTVNIGSIIPSSKTINLGGPINCVNGASVWLAAKSDAVNVLPGSAPFIGALPAAQVSPYTLTANCLGSAPGTIACTNNGGYTCPTPKINATCTAGVASGQTTQIATDGDTPKFTATGSFIAWNGLCTGTSNPCTSTSVNSNGPFTISAQFSTLPTISLTPDTNFCNPVNGPCTFTYSVPVGNCNVAGCVWSALDYPSGAILTDVTTGQLAYCAYGITVNALCGDGVHPSGTFSIRRTITDFSQGSSAQAIGNVFIPPNVLVQTSPVLVGFGSFVAPGGSWLQF